MPISTYSVGGGSWSGGGVTPRIPPDRKEWSLAARKLDELIAIHTISWHWVKGHSGHPQNERADALARNAIIAQSMAAIKV